jgi:4-amino-4-deoxy-L-arabinose transferase-like glycosyltransferase
LINPFREMLSEDDSWAYARMVEHLLKTGKYELDAWSAANMPVQIYLAAAASKVAGYSLSILRGTTLTLFLVGVSSFYLLLREFGRDRAAAALATCALVASPLVLMLAFTFMSDVQFLGWLLLALWLYARGISRASLAPILLASIAAGCAIG